MRGMMFFNERVDVFYERWEIRCFIGDYERLDVFI